MHDLNRGDFEGFCKAESGDRTTGFVMDIEDIEIFQFGVVFEEPTFDNLGAARNRSETAEKEFAAGDEKNVFFGEFCKFGFRAGKAGAEKVDCVAHSFESGFLSVDRAHDATGEVEITIGEESDFHIYYYNIVI